MQPFFVRDGPALLVQNSQRVLVVADLHFGAESGYARGGVHIPSNSSARLERLLGCIDDCSPDLLVLLGDVKHSVPLTSRQEYRELPGILDSIRDRVDIRVTPGNHDAGLQRFLNDDELMPVNGAVIDGVGYLHGHTLPDPALLGHLLVIGHHHPVVHLYDDVGCALRSHPAYLLSTLDTACLKQRMPEAATETRVLFVPAFLELAGGMDVCELKKSRLGPISRCIREDDAEVFLDDGTYISTLAALMEDNVSRTA